MVDLEKIREEIATLPQDRQVLLQTDGIHDGTGWFEGDESDMIIPIYDIPYINKSLKERGIARARVMRMPPKTCYSWHKDQTKRLHIPVYTQPGSCMIVEDEVIRFTEGVPVVVDTTKMHTAINPGPGERIHIVGVLHGDSDLPSRQ